MPKTFRDVVQITRELGLRYLWIDSLCIIQDDHEDRVRESARMGQVYEGPRLTIAASQAHNSTEGCFLARYYVPPPIELDYIDASGDNLGYMYI